jgi:transposase
MVLHGSTRVKLIKESRRTQDARYRTRCLIVLRSGEGWSVRRVAQALSCSISTVSKTRRRFEVWGLAGLIDRREDNGDRKSDERYIQTVRWLLEGTPLDRGLSRPTWTKRLLIDQACAETGVKVSLTTMGRVLKKLGARRGRAKPMGPCPWSKSRRKQRLKLISALIASTPADQAVVWEDEADIDLNPKIGVDWMLPGTQRLVRTPGKNKKHYFAAAMDAHSDRLTWVSAGKKNSGLFIAMLKKLLVSYADRTRIHLILDNFVIHSSRQTQAWLAEHGHRIRLHFLPPYSPDDNRIERKLWREVHANVTINHRCVSIEQLCGEVRSYMITHNRRISGVREMRTSI